MAKAKVTVTATDNLAKGLNQSKKQLTDFEKYIQGIGKKLDKAFSFTAVATAAVASFKAMSSAARECIQEYSEAEKVSKRLEAVWANVGAATGKTAKQMDDYAESLEKVTYFSSESIKEAGLLLAATESLSQDGFQRALDVSVDLAAALGEDVTSAAQTLAKAIQEPESALSRLKTIGVSFTDDEKAQIKALSDANKTYEAQAMILDKVEEKYRGVAKAINDTPAGKLDNIRDVLSDIRKNLGETLLNSISPALDTLYNSLVRISNWIAQMATSTGVISALQGGEDLTRFSVAELELGLKAVNEALKSNRNEIKAHQNSYLQYRAALEKEIEFRGTLTGGVAQPSSSTGTNAVTPTDKVVENALKTYLKSYGKLSVQYQKDALIEAINQATAFRDELTRPSGIGNTRTALSGAMEKYDMTGAEIFAADQYLSEIIADLTKQLDAIENPLSNISSEFPSPTRQTQGYETEISYVQSPTFLDNIGNAIADAFIHNGIGLGGQAKAFGSSVVQTATENLGKTGEVAGKLATNMATMGPLLGAIATALEYVLKGVNEVAGPMLDMITDSVIQPLVEVGKSLGRLILPVLNDLAPVLQFLGSVVVGVVAVFEWVGQLLRHWAASFVNAFTWITGYSMYDPGGPGNIADFVGNRISEYKDSLGADTSSNSVSTGTAVSSASYRGATSVTINVYTGAIVGDGGMREFARMIRDEFDALDYYGVSA